MNDARIHTQLAINFAIISILAFGGANATLPEMHRMVVDANHWMDSATFTRLFALAQAAPGPNVMVVTLIGWQVAGLLGAFISTLAMVVPSFFLTFGISSFLPRWRQLNWYKLLEKGLAPITVGLVLASAYLLTRNTSISIGAILVTAAAVGYILILKRNPIHTLIFGALLGAAGWI